MWTKGRRSQLLLIKVQRLKHHELIIPISLVAINQLLRSVRDLVAMVEFLLPAKLVWRCWGQKRQVGEAFNLIRELWDEIRSYGSWPVAEVEDGDIKVTVRFY
jgi:hypothetical protein